VDARSLITQESRRLGFAHLRVAAIGDAPEPCPRIEHLDSWLSAGRHADMDWIVRGRDVRANPRLRGEAARSAVVLSFEHHHQRPPDPGGLTGMVARYAWGRDYHNLVGKRLRKLLKRLRAAGIACWGGIDTAPIFERAWAAEAGLGFQGKNALQIWPAGGSWMFLAVIFTEEPLVPDAPLGDHCGSCTRCLDACPTGALVGPGQLDARACIAYWTIEARGAIPEALRPGFGRWVFGCDVCQEVCPHNVSPPEPDEDDLLPRNAWLDLEWLLTASDDAILARFLGTPIRRPGPNGLRRNAAVVLGNLGDPAAASALRRVADSGDPMVAEHARWALDRLGV